jgi:sugar phosphate isomerase/epimerase
VPQVTVDMAAYVNDGEVKLACGYQGGEVDFSEQASLGWEDTARLIADSGANRTIAEVGLDPATGTWFYKNLRPDKDRANDLKTVLATLLELAENVGAEELEARLLGCSGAAWDDARRAHAATLVDAQRRCAADQRAAAKTSKKK